MIPPSSLIISSGMELIDLSLRASNEHSFIVRVLRARRAPGRSLLTPSRGRALREHRRIATIYSKLARLFPKRGALQNLSPYHPALAGWLA